MRKSQRILAVVNDRELYDKIAHLLDRSSFEVNRVPSGAGALILVGNLRYDLILVEAPLPDLDLQDFVAAVRTLDSPCAGSSVLALGKTEEACNLGDTLVGDDIAVLPASAEADEIQTTISKSLGVAVRTAARLLVQVDAQLEEGSFQRMTQTANISETGMLLSGAPPIALGTEVRLAFELPDDPRTLVITAEVVRHASQEVENLSGIGVRFLQFETDSGTRLEDYLRGRVADPGANVAEPFDELGDVAPSVG
jgi:CheY-like chemotaxis protein